MQKQNFIYLVTVIAILSGQYAAGMVFDNRYIPLLQRPRISINKSRSAFSTAYMVSTASSAFNGSQETIPLGQLFGQLDQAQLAKSMVATGFANELPPEYQGVVSKIPWNVAGKRQMQGVNFQWDQKITHWLQTGFSWFFMQVKSHHDFALIASGIESEMGSISVTNSEAILLEQSRRSMFDTLNLNDGNTAQLGFGDIDCYLRVGNVWDYALRFRRIDAGFRLGLLAPTGQSRLADRPASIPFGGNGHWGMYGAFDGMFELREDWIAGLWLRASKRFSDTRCRRMPAGLEPVIFGTITGDASVSPGATVVFAPYIALENVRKGLTLGLNYTLTYHAKDSWCDLRKDPTTPAVLTHVEDFSKWIAEYFTINIQYDFGTLDTNNPFNPVFTVRWDIPSSLFLVNRIDNTHKIELGLSFVF